MSKITAHEQGRSIYVLGTVSMFEAREALPDDVAGWDRSEVGAFARRQGLLRWYPIADTTPKDAQVGIRFSGIRKSTASVTPGPPRMNGSTAIAASNVPGLILEHDHDPGGCTCGCPVPGCLPCGGELESTNSERSK